MSLFPSYGWYGAYGGYGWGMPQAERVESAPDPDAKVKVGELLDRDGPNGGYAVSADPRGPNPFSKAPNGDAELYWNMRRYSACVLAFAVATAPIFAGTRTLQIRKPDGTKAKPKSAAGLYASEGPQTSPEDDLKADLERHFEPQWTDILAGLECLNLGYWTQEVLWDRVGDLTLPVRFKDFDADEIVKAWHKTGPLIYLQNNRDFAGIRYKKEERDPRYILHHVHQRHLNRIFGYARNEYARDEWYRAWMTNEGIERAQDKATGISVMLLVDYNYDFRDAAGNRVRPQEVGQTWINALTRAKGIVGPRHTYSQKAIEQRPELAEHSPVTAQQFDWGETAPAILSLISLLDARDKRVIRCWRRPEREATEGQHGTKAESAVQGALGTLDCEMIHQERLDQINCQVMDPLLVTNKGPDWKGRLYWKPTPLADPQQEFLQDVAKAMAAAPGDPFGQQIDRKALAKRVEVPVDENYRPVPPLPDGTQPGMPGTPGQGGLSGMSDEELLAHADSLLGGGTNGTPRPGKNGNGRMARMGL